MENIYKFFWIFRAICYKVFFKKIGFLSYIGKPIFLSGVKKISIGSKVRIFPGARFEVIGKNSSIVIEDEVAISHNVHITSCANLIIGAKTTILGNVCITNIDHEYKLIDEHVLKQPLIVKKTIINSNCFIGYGARIQAGTILGHQCIIGANAVVRGVFPDFSVIVGAPGKIIKRYNHKTEKWEKTNSNGEFVNEV